MPSLATATITTPVATAASLYSTLPIITHNTLPVTSVNSKKSSNQETINKLLCSEERQKIKDALAAVPENVDASSPELKKLLEARKEYSQCSFKEAESTADPKLKAKLLQEALFNNNDGGRENDFKIRNLINQTYIKYEKELTKAEKLDLTLARKINTEARYQSRVARGKDAQAQKLWDSGTRGKVTVDGVDTAYHVVKAASSRGEHHPLVVIAPGRGEPMENYMEMVSELNAANRDVIVVGFTGNGDVGHPGHLEDFSDTTKGLAQIIAQRNDITGVQHKSVSIIAHSTGATTATRYCEGDPKDPAVKQMVLIAPLFEIKASYTSLLAARVADIILDTAESVTNTLISPFTDRRVNLDAIHIANRDSYYDGNDYTQSLPRYNQLVKVRDKHKTMPPTVSWVHEAQKATHLALKDADKLKDENIDILVFMAGKDGVVKNEKTREFIEKSNAKGIMIEGALHSLVQEADSYRAPMMQKILKFTR